MYRVLVVVFSFPPGTGARRFSVSVHPSPGLTGFPAGSVYVAYPNDGLNSTIVAAIPAAGGAPSPLGSIAGKFDHVGLLLDTSGLYGSGLLAFTETGQVYRFSTGLVPNAPAFVGTISGIPSPHLELPVIAPQGFGPAGGQVWIVNEREDGTGDNKIYAVSPALTAVAVLDTDAVLGSGDRTEGVRVGSGGLAPAAVVPALVALATLALGATAMARRRRIASRPRRS